MHFWKTCQYDSKCSIHGNQFHRWNQQDGLWWTVHLIPPWHIFNANVAQTWTSTEEMVDLIGILGFDSEIEWKEYVETSKDSSKDGNITDHLLPSFDVFHLGTQEIGPEYPPRRELSVDGSFWRWRGVSTTIVANKKMQFVQFTTQELQLNPAYLNKQTASYILTSPPTSSTDRYSAVIQFYRSSKCRVR